MEWVIEMSRFQISEEEYRAIQEAEKATKDKKVSRRLRILMMRYEGYKVREIAQIMGMQINSISQRAGDSASKDWSVLSRRNMAGIGEP